MTSPLWTIALAQASQQPSAFKQLMPMVLIFLVFYVVWFLPLRKKQKALDEMVNNLSKGDKVITNGGFYGKVVKVDGDVVLLELADNVRARVAKRAIAGLEGTQAEHGS